MSVEFSGSDAHAWRRALAMLPAPDVAVVNLALGGEESPGISLIRTIKREFPAMGIVSLKRRVDEHQLRAALDAGADACCLATTSGHRLRSAIKAVAEGAAWLDPEISKVILHGDRPPSSPPKPGPHLTVRERSVLALVVEGYRNEEIASQLGCSEATVKAHVMNLFHKLDVHDRVSAAVLALRIGLI